MCGKQYGVRSSGRCRQRAGVLVQVAVMCTVITGFGALTIDLGTLYRARGELQRAADSAALAGASTYFTNSGLLADNDALTTMGIERAQTYSYVNPTLCQGTFLETADVALGTFDLDYPDAGLDTSGTQRFNAVQVLVRRTEDSSNGPISYFFAKVLGFYEGGLVTSATAAVDDRFSGFRQTDENPLLVPFVIHQDCYEEMLVSGPDEWSYEDGEVIEFGDGVREIKLYPWKQSGNNGDPGNDGAGNFGLLNIGVNNHGVPYIEGQIRNGIAPEDLEEEIGTSQVTFYDEDGNPVTYEITGTPGLKAGMEDAVDDRVGQIIAFFLHDQVSGTGANAVYRIVDIRFGRVMDVNLHGNPNNKHISAQPVAYTGLGVMTEHYADSTNGQVGNLRLVR